MRRWPISLILFASVLATAQKRRAVNFYSNEKEASLVRYPSRNFDGPSRPRVGV